MKRIKNFLWFFYECFAFYSIVVYALVQWTPSGGWLAGFMMMSFPVVFAVHILSLPIWFLIEKKKALLPLILVLIGCIFLPRTYVFGNDDHVASDEHGNTFSFLSYNTHTFMKMVDPAVKQDLSDEIGSLQSWLGDSGADILCMPEYYEAAWKPFRVQDVLSKAGYKYAVKYTNESHRNERQYWGLAIYSKFPVIASKDTVFEAQNGMIQADIRIGKDTVRVIGLHLYSMTLNLGKLAEQKKMRGLKKEGKFTFTKMKNGFVARASELKILQSWIADSPYPVIVGGDFNEVPYGYVYGKLRETMNNAFEEKGNGFGFTFNHLPYFIRIDHQFYSPEKIEIVDFKTMNKIKYSDHYPILGVYKTLDK